MIAHRPLSSPLKVPLKLWISPCLILGSNDQRYHQLKFLQVCEVPILEDVAKTRRIMGDNEVRRQAAHFHAHGFVHVNNRVEYAREDLKYRSIPALAEVFVHFVIILQRRSQYLVFPQLNIPYQQSSAKPLDLLPAFRGYGLSRSFWGHVKQENTLTLNLERLVEKE